MFHDWMGHGCNQMKRSALHTPELAVCSHCGKLDNQAHIMLECSHPSLQPIRDTARLTQHRLAHVLRLKHPYHLHCYFIEQLTHASWTPSPSQTRRIWLGMWSHETLQNLLPNANTILEDMATPDRYTFRYIARVLTAPLIDAYKKMITLRLSHHTATIVGTMPTVPLRTRRHTQALFYHETNSTVIPHMHTHPIHGPPNTFTYSDAAFSLTDAEIGILHDPITF